MTAATIDDSSRTWGPTHMAMIEFERGRWKNPGARDAAIAARFQVLPTEYNVVLGWVLDQHQALEYDLELVGHLREKRERLRTARSESRRRFDL